MATTLPGSPYVESSDLVAGYPGVSESLAERVDTVGVLPFADSTARGTALPSPTDGQYSYLQDTNATEYWDGAAWVAVGGSTANGVDTIATLQTTTSSTYTDLATVGPVVTLTTGTRALVIVTAKIFITGGTANAYASVAVSGASTIAADDENAAISSAINLNWRFTSAYIVTGLTAGSNIFTMKYKRSGNTGNFGSRTLSVIDMGS